MTDRPGGFGPSFSVGLGSGLASSFLMGGANGAMLAVQAPVVQIVESPAVQEFIEEDLPLLKDGAYYVYRAVADGVVRYIGITTT